MKSPAVLALVLTGLLLAPMVPAAADRATEAPAALPWWETTVLDQDRDGIDDSIEDATSALRVLVNYETPPTDEDVQRVLDLGALVPYQVRTIPVLVVDTPADLLDDLAALPGVVLVEEDHPLELHLDESRDLIKAERAAKVTGETGGLGVGVAIIDTGVDPTHPDLRDRLEATYDATIPQTPLIGGLLGGNSQATVPTDEEGHGTHVAGIAGGPGAQSGGDYAGIAPATGLVGIKVFDAQGGSSSSYVLKAIDWVDDNSDTYNIRVMQMSLGGKPTDGTDSLSRAVNVAADDGLLSVVSAGNTGPDPETVGLPGVAARALTIAAVDKDLEIADFSSRGPTPDGRQKPDMVAPGVQITSTLPAPAAVGGSGDAYYGPLSGTSMAAPHVAGVAAMMFQANPDLTPAEAKWILMVASRDVGPNGGQWDAAHGWGFVDAEAAVKAAIDRDTIGQVREFALKANAIPVDGSEDPLERFAVGAADVQRSVPAPAMFAPLALLAMAFVIGRRW